MTESQSPRVGVWFLGAFGSLATTAIVGARAIARRLAMPIGLVSESVEFKALGLAPIDGLVFGGHEVRRDSLAASATAISKENGSIPEPWIRELKEDLETATRRVRPGTALGGGAAIEGLADLRESVAAERGRDCVERLAGDLKRFRADEKLDGSWS